MSHFLSYLRQQAALPPHLRDPDPPEPSSEEVAARQADLERRIQADIDATEARPVRSGPPGCGVIDVPRCMLDAFGLVEMD